MLTISWSWIFYMSTTFQFLPAQSSLLDGIVRASDWARTKIAAGHYHHDYLPVSLASNYCWENAGNRLGQPTQLNLERWAVFGLVCVCMSVCLCVCVCVWAWNQQYICRHSTCDVCVETAGLVMSQHKCSLEKCVCVCVCVCKLRLIPTHINHLKELEHGERA